MTIILVDAEKVLNDTTSPVSRHSTCVTNKRLPIQTRNHKTIAIIIYIAFLISCSQSLSNNPVLAPNTPVEQIGAIVYSPNETDWFLGRTSDKYITVFGEQGTSPIDTTIIYAAIFKVGNIEYDSEFFSRIDLETDTDALGSRFNSLQFSREQVSIKNTVCVKYRGLAEDHGPNGIDSKAFLYFKTSGYLCRHPFNKSYVMRVEISNRSTSKEYPESLLLIGESFFFIHEI